MENENAQNTKLVEAIDEILDTLAYDADNPVRTIRLDDKREVVLIQSNAFTLSRIYAAGRPDGKRPHGRECYLEYFTEQLEDYKKSHGSDEKFSLTPEDWRALFRESHDRYVRYLLFSGIKRWKDVKRDTEENIAIADFAKKYAPYEIAWDIYQYKGYMLMMNTISQAELSLMRGNLDEALEKIDIGINLIGKFCGECLREGREDAENITRERYSSNLVQLRSDIESVGTRLRERRFRRDDFDEDFDFDEDRLDETELNELLAELEELDGDEEE